MKVDFSITISKSLTIPSFILNTNVKPQSWQKYWYRTSHDFEEEWAKPFRKKYSQDIRVEISSEEFIRVDVYASNPLAFLDQLGNDNMMLPVKFRSRNIKVTSVKAPQYQLTSNTAEDLQKISRRYLSETNKISNDERLMDTLRTFYQSQDEKNFMQVMENMVPIDSSEDSESY